MDDTWLKLYRKLVEWQWYTDANTLRVFIHLLITANYKANSWKSETIEAGQLITSNARLASDLDLSIKQIRNALKKLQKSNDIDVKGASRYSLITLLNWGVYQEEGQSKGKQGANKGQARGKQRATLKERKKDIKIEGENKDISAADKPATKSSSSNQVHLDFSNWHRPLTDDELKTINDNRKAKRAKPLTQMTLNAIGKQIAKAVEQGTPFDDCIETWVLRSWVSFDASWINKRNGKTDVTKANDAALEQFLSRNEKVINP